MFRINVLMPLDEQNLRILLDALVRLNILYLRRNPRTPLLFQSGVRYSSDDPSEEWLTIPELYRRRFGDCEDLACARVAELRVRGYPAAPFISMKKRIGGGDLYHIRVRIGDRIEDPSRLLGMR